MIMHQPHIFATRVVRSIRSSRSGDDIIVARTVRTSYIKTKTLTVPTTAGVATRSCAAAASRTRPSGVHQQKIEVDGRLFSSTSVGGGGNEVEKQSSSSLRIPAHAAHKVCTPSDAVSLISRGDTIAVSGFVAQGSPDLILKALSDRYDQECRDGVEHGLGNLTLLFGGGPGDWEKRGLNYLAKVPEVEGAKSMIKRAIGSHYGQVPLLGELAVSNEIEAWVFPMGSISRMIRAQATHSPGHITTIGLGTYVDPTPGVGKGGAANDLALQSPLHRELVTKLSLGYDGKLRSDYLLYKALPINVGIIRGTTADSNGNISGEHESLLCDQRSIAMAARNSGGIVIAQVKRLCEVGSLSSRDVMVPGAMIDCVVVVDDEDQEQYHPMSYVTKQSAVLTGEIKAPMENLPKMKLNERKVIARRASKALKPGQIVNLGIGLPEGVASVAGEEGMLPYITLTTEPGSFGGLPASGHEFGPSFNADAIIPLHQQFDFYDGGGLDIAFLGAGQISKTGDVNVSRMSASRLTGAGGFVDISQSTKKICFMSTFTAKGDVSIEDGNISVRQEGKIRKFVDEVYERTFSGTEAVRRGQKVYYVTERCVFRKTASHDELELIEIAPGIDLEKDILAHMEFTPAISSDIKLMDNKIFQEGRMDLQLFGSLADRCTYHTEDHLFYMNLFGVSLQTPSDIQWFRTSLDQILHPLTKDRGPVDVVVNYDGFDLHIGLEEIYADALTELEKRHYKSVKRYSGTAFRPSLLRTKSKIETWNEREMFQLFDEDSDGMISPEELLRGVRKLFGLRLKQGELESLCHEKIHIGNFSEVITKCLSEFGSTE